MVLLRQSGKQEYLEELVKMQVQIQEGRVRPELLRF